MSRRTYSFNAFTSQLASPITAGSTSITLNSTTGLQAPCYLAIAPDSTTKREYVKVLNLSAPTLENVTRGLPGSVAGAQAHDSGVEVRAVMVHQIIDDIFQDIIDLESGASGHYGGIDATDHPEATTTSRGFMSSADKSKLDLIEALAEVNDSANEILNKLLTVDGAGSQLDADLLDGVQGSGYAVSGHDHDADYAVLGHTHADNYSLLAAGGAMHSTPGALTTTLTQKAALVFNKPTGWNTYEITMVGQANGKADDASGELNARAYIGGNAGTLSVASPGVATGCGVAVQHFRQGLSDSSVTIEIRVAESSGQASYFNSAIQFVARRQS